LSFKNNILFFSPPEASAESSLLKDIIRMAGRGEEGGGGGQQGGGGGRVRTVDNRPSGANPGVGNKRKCSSFGTESVETWASTEVINTIN
jgi:hypothetical protein